jgi:tripartite-type tricarboxylate transporter receptor subunit TctC
MGAGGGTDLIARAVIAGAQKHIKQPLIPVNRPGAGGMVGAEHVMRQRPDGYSILFSPLSTIAAQPHFGVARYTHNTFQPVIRTSEGVHVFVVRADAPWKTFAEFVDYARKNPGKIAYGSPGAGTTSHLSTEFMARELGFRLTHVPFPGGAEATTAMLGGHVDAVGSLAVGEIDRTRIRVLVIKGELKTPALRDVPTLRELGYNFSFPVTNGIVAPAGTPAEVVAVLHDAFKKAIEDPDVIRMLNRVSAVPSYGSAETQQREFTEFFHRFGRIMRQAGIIQ